MSYGGVGGRANGCTPRARAQRRGTYSGCTRRARWASLYASCRRDGSGISPKSRSLHRGRSYCHLPVSAFGFAPKARNLGAGEQMRELSGPCKSILPTHGVCMLKLKPYRPRPSPRQTRLHIARLSFAQAQTGKTVSAARGRATELRPRPDARPTCGGPSASRRKTARRAP